MVFWTFVFIAFRFILLMKGNFLRNTSIKNGELKIKIASEGIKTETQIETLKNLTPILFLLILAISELIYLLTAIDNDFYKYPTLILIAWTIFNIAKVKTKKDESVDLSTEQKIADYRATIYNEPKRTFRGTLINLVYTGYFCYMLYCLVFLGM